MRSTLPFAAAIGALVLLLEVTLLFRTTGELDAQAARLLLIGGVVGVGLAAVVGWGLGAKRAAAPQPPPPPERDDVREDDVPSSATSLARISHEVRTPLNALLGYVELLQEDSVGEAASDLMRVRSAALQVMGIVTSALDLEQLHDRTHASRPEALRIDELVHEVADSVRIEAEANGNRLLVTATPGPAPVLDRRMVRSILFNLAANACQYTANGTVTIEARPTSRGLHLQVSDTGIGMTERQIEDLSSKATPAIERPCAGAGYGIALVRGFTQALGGTVTFTSTPGSGTRVIVDLPSAH